MHPGDMTLSYVPHDALHIWVTYNTILALASGESIAPNTKGAEKIDLSFYNIFGEYKKGLVGKRYPCCL